MVRTEFLYVLAKYTKGNWRNVTKAFSSREQARRVLRLWKIMNQDLNVHYQIIRYCPDYHWFE
jgi:hypothetical protein